MYASSDDVYGQDRQRYFRLASILHDEGQYILRLYFRTFYQGKTLKEYLADPNVKRKLDTLRTNKMLFPDQYSLLSSCTDTEAFDISLLTLLIRRLHPEVKADSNVWTKPQPCDLSPVADITRIKDLRNDLLGHSTTNRVNENDFQYFYSQLDMLFARLLKNMGCSAATVEDVSDIIRDKKNGSLEPAQERMLTKILQLWQLEKSQLEECVNKSVQKSMENVQASFKELSDDIKETMKRQPKVYVRREIATSTSDSLEHDGHVDVSTSTTSLQRTPSIRRRLKSFIMPFITNPRQRPPKPPYSDFLPRKNTRYRQTSKKRRADNYCRLSCLQTTRRQLKTWDHSDSDCRCRITGMAHLSNGLVVLTDLAHDSIQVLNSQGDLVDEISYPMPRAVCAISSDTAAVILSQAKRILLLNITEADGIKYNGEVDIECPDGWLLDIAFRNEQMYLLCDRRHVHVVNLRAGTDLLMDVPDDIRACCLAVSATADVIFLGGVNGVHCMNTSGQLVGWFRGNHQVGFFKPSAMCQYKGKLLLTSWEDNAVVQFDVDSFGVRKFGMDCLHRPLCVHVSEKGIMHVSQYMTDLNSELCSEIAVFRL